MTRSPPQRDVTEQDFNLWRHHPVTALVLRYLADYREALIVDHVAAWQAGNLDPTRDAEIRGRVISCAELAELKLDAIAQFYDWPAPPAAEPEGTNAA